MECGGRAKSVSAKRRHRFERFTQNNKRPALKAVSPVALRALSATALQKQAGCPRLLPGKIPRVNQPDFRQSPRMKKSPHLPRSLVSLLLLLPLVFQVVLFAAAFLATVASAYDWFLKFISLLMSSLVMGYPCFRLGQMLVRDSYASRKNTEAARMDPSSNFFMRYLGVVIACGYTALMALIAVFLPPWENCGDFGFKVMVLSCCHLPSSVVGFTMFSSVAKAWIFLIPSFFVYLVYAIGMAWEFRKMCVPRAQWRGKAVFAAVFVLCAVVFVWRVCVLQNSVLH